MALAIAQTITASVSSGDTINLTSWSPSAYDLILIGIAARETKNGLVDSIVGNGLSYTQVTNVTNDDNKHRLRVYRAMGASPTSGSITITLDSNSDPVQVVALRITGADTSGSSGSSAVEVVAKDDGPSGSNNDMKDTLTAISDNAFVIAFGSHRGETFTVPGGETSVSINNSVGSGSDETSLSVWYEAITTAGSTELGDDNDLGSSTDWAMITISIKPSLIEVSEVTGLAYRQFNNEFRKVNIKTANDDFIMSAFGKCHPLTSEYKGNEIEGTQIKNTIRVVIRHGTRQKVALGYLIYITPVHCYQIISIKPFGSNTEIIGVSELTTDAKEPDVIKTFDLASGTSETTIWQPTNGKKFRLMEVQANIVGAPSSKLIFRDNTAGTVILQGTTSGPYATGRLGNGILSTAIDQPLTVERSVAVQLTGHVLGFEE